MAANKTKAARTTVYRLIGLSDLKVAIRSKYRDEHDFVETETRIEEHPALLVVGEIQKDRAAWADRLSQIAGQRLSVGNTTAAAVLVVRDQADTAYALTYGMGFQLLDPAYIDPGFGMRIAVRTASPDALQSLTRTELDHRSKTDRSSIPAGEGLRGFGIGDFGEVVTRLAGSARIEGLTTASSLIRLRAADAVSLPIAKTSKGVVSDLHALSAALELDPKPELHMLEQFVKVKRQDLIDQLNDALRSTLRGTNAGRAALGWPHERIDENGTPSSFRFSGAGAGEGHIRDDLPSYSDLVPVLRAKNSADPLEAARRVKIQLFRDADGTEPISGAIPAVNWLFFEVDHPDARYCLFDGSWYAMDTDYATKLQAHVDEIFARNSSVSLPEWDLGKAGDEAAYNVLAAEAVGGCVLDREPIHTTHHPRGFEACDIITQHEEFIHVKHVPRSSAASHLIAQAIVSTEALRHDVEARDAVKAKVAAAGGDGSWVPVRPNSVVLGMARERAITPADLFTFTQVTLSRLDSSLYVAGARLTVVPIIRS